MRVGDKTDVFQSEDIWGTVDAETAWFKVKRDGVVVYEGRAEVYPDGGRIKVYVNRIARGLLDAGELPTETETVYRNADGVASLTVEFEDDEGDPISTLTTTRVWLGNGVFDQTGRMFTSDPINGHASPAMLLFLSHSARYAFTVELS